RLRESRSATRSVAAKGASAGILPAFSARYREFEVVPNLPLAPRLLVRYPCAARVAVLGEETDLVSIGQRLGAVNECRREKEGGQGSARARRAMQGLAQDPHAAGSSQASHQGRTIRLGKREIRRQQIEFRHRVELGDLGYGA